MYLNFVVSDQSFHCRTQQERVDVIALLIGILEIQVVALVKVAQHGVDLRRMKALSLDSPTNSAASRLSIMYALSRVLVA